MRLKYQLRGLGIGIVLTAAFLMAFGNEGEASGKKEDTIVGDSAENDVLQSSVEFEILSEETSMTVHCLETLLLLGHCDIQLSICIYALCNSDSLPIHIHEGFGDSVQ